ncbi:TPA: hypothetical protein DDZ86_02515 [Candidatus Dependentiae bacterium]|nr:MAG: hypothetical protein UW09_C0001G0145 [candidate division TM6 bacterium GW2011_GWF2_43_87]HBL98492.1 hypothetical protein [Candidatus Dependentiae bacterium]
MLRKTFKHVIICASLVSALVQPLIMHATNTTLTPTISVNPSAPIKLTPSALRLAMLKNSALQFCYLFPMLCTVYTSMLCALAVPMFLGFAAQYLNLLWVTHGGRLHHIPSSHLIFHPTTRLPFVPAGEDQSITRIRTLWIKSIWPYSEHLQNLLEGDSKNAIPKEALDALIETLPDDCRSLTAWKTLTYLTTTLSQRAIQPDKVTASLVEKILREYRQSINLAELYALSSFLLMPKGISESILNCIANDLANNATESLNDPRVGLLIRESLAEKGTVATSLLQLHSRLLFTENTGNYVEKSGTWVPLHTSQEDAPASSMGVFFAPPTNTLSNSFVGNKMASSFGNGTFIDSSWPFFTNQANNYANNDFLILDSHGKIVRRVPLANEWNNNFCSLNLSADAQFLLKTDGITFKLLDVSGLNRPSCTRMLNMPQLNTACVNARLSRDGYHICLLNQINGCEIQTLQSNQVLFAQTLTWYPEEVVVSPDEKFVILSGNGHCEIWACMGPNSAQRLFSSQTHSAAAFNPAGTELALTNANGTTIDLWKLPKENEAWPQNPIRSIKLANQVNTFPCFCNYSPDGTQLALSQFNEGMVEIFDALSCAPVYTIQTHSKISDFTWRPDGTLVTCHKSNHALHFFETWKPDMVELSADQYVLVEALKHANPGTTLTNGSWADIVFKTLPNSVQEWLKTQRGTYLTNVQPQGSFSSLCTPLTRPFTQAKSLIKEVTTKRRYELLPLAYISALTAASAIASISCWKFVKPLNARLTALNQQQLALQFALLALIKQTK